LKQEENKAICEVYQQFFEKYNRGYLEEHVSQDDLLSDRAMEDHAKRALSETIQGMANYDVQQALRSVRIRSAWRVEGTLREYPKFEPVNMWFQYPVHKVDEVGSLKDIEPEGEKPAWQKATDKRKDKANKERRSKAEEFEDAVNNCKFGEPPTVKDIVEWYSSTGKAVAERTVRDWVKKYGYLIDKENGNVIVKVDGGEDHD
ncbi:DNA primase, partial [Brevibacillus laterosporus]